MPDTLAQLVKKKYPGTYDDLSDADLEARVLAKYPGVYDDLPRTAKGAAPQTLGEMIRNQPMDEGGNPIGQPSALRQSLESMAYPTSLSEMSGLAIPGGAEVAQAIRSGIRSAPTLIGAAAGYAHSGIPGAIEGAMGGGVVGAIGRAVKGAYQAAREVKATASPAEQVLTAMKDAGTTIQAQHFSEAVNRVAKGEPVADVIKDLSGKVPATTAERKAAFPPQAGAEIIPLSAKLLESLPPMPAPPPANLPAPAAAIPVPEAAALPASWRPYAGQTELGQVMPAQPPGMTSAGNPQASRPYVPKPPSASPASAVNQAMRDLGLRFPAKFMDAAIKRVKAGESAADVVRSYAAAQ